MNYRKATVYSETDASTAKTESIDLNLTDIISRLQVRFNIINASAAITDHPAKIAKKVEIVDGSDVLWSLTGQEIEAMDFYDTDRPRDYELDYRGFWPCQLNLKLNFGRYLYDPLLAFNCAKFNNPQLKVTHDKALGGSAPGSMKLQVIADVFDEKVPTPTGFLTSKEYYSFACAATTYKTVDMPTDYVLRKMLIKSQYPTNSFTDQIDEIRIDENNLKKIPLDLNMFHYLGSIENAHPLYQEHVAFSGAEFGGYLYVTPGEYPAVAWNQSGTPTAYLTADQGGGKLTVTGAGSSTYRALVSGYLPHCCVPIEFGDQQKLEDWYDITKIKDLNLRLHTVPATGTVEVITQQLRKY